MEVNNSKKIHVPAAYIAVIFGAIFISASFLVIGSASQSYGQSTSNITKAMTTLSITKNKNQQNLNSVQDAGSNTGL